MWEKEDTDGRSRGLRKNLVLGPECKLEGPQYKLIPYFTYIYICRDRESFLTLSTEKA